MADNYLERQREQYEARKAAWKKAKKLGRKNNTKKKDSTVKKEPKETSLCSNIQKLGTQ